MINWQLFKDLLSIDSTSGKERETALWLYNHLDAPQKELMEVSDGTLNLLCSWGTPRVVFCTHMDTVPPYIAPVFPEGIPLGGHVHPRTWVVGGARCDSSGRGRSEQSERSSSEGESLRITGRGSCDAKGQIFAMYTACKALEADGHTGFGLLLLSGEETGSWGAKAFAQTDFKAHYLIVGEPTDNKMVSASKGTLSYDLKFTGEPFHSGYPQYGVSAINLFHAFYSRLKAMDFGQDPMLGATTWNVGLLHSDNPQNILAPELTCRLYFRTTFVSHQAVQEWMAEAGREVLLPGAFARTGSQSDSAGKDLSSAALTVTARGGDTPARYLTLPGFASAPVAFGSDAPHLSNFTHKAICGPGSIRVAHRPQEFITVSDLETAVQQYVQMFSDLQQLDSQ